MRTWYDIEDAKYSDLYANDYPIGDPMGLVNRFDYEETLNICDLGCGRATLSNRFKKYTGVDVSKYIIDLNKENKDGDYFHASLHDLSQIHDRRFDLVICADVMEHIPPQEVEGVLNEISKLKTNKFAFSISTRPSVFLDKEGDNLHLTVWDDDKWLKELEKKFTVVRAMPKTKLLSVELENNE